MCMCVHVMNINRQDAFVVELFVNGVKVPTPRHADVSGFSGTYLQSPVPSPYTALVTSSTLSPPHQPTVSCYTIACTTSGHALARSTLA